MRAEQGAEGRRQPDPTAETDDSTEIFAPQLRLGNCAGPRRVRGLGRSTLALRDAITRLMTEGDSAPWTVRQLFYAVTVAGGIEKTEAGYRQVQRQALLMRREGLIHYSKIADNTRWVRRVETFNGLDDWVDESLRTLRIDLWRESEHRCEVWIEKDALAGVLMPTTIRWHVPMYVTRGYASETFAYEAAQNALNDGRLVRVLYLGDFDASGIHMARDLETRLRGFLGASANLLIFDRIAVTTAQIDAWGLPSRPNKATDTRHAHFEREFPGYEATELDAIRPGRLRELVETAITRLIDAEQIARIRREEREARALAGQITAQFRAGGAR